MSRATSLAHIDPVVHDGPKLFIIDARNGVERRTLLDWLKKRWGSAAPLDWVSLPLSNEQKPLLLDQLSARLAAATDVLVVPVRIVWRIPDFDKERTLRLRDILFGNPRLPGSLRARIILMRERRRAHCITGEPAMISELRQRFGEQVADEEAESAQEFAGFVARQAAISLDAEERGVQGARYKVPRFVADSIAASPDFRQQLAKLGSGLMPEARRYMKELISTPGALFLDLRARFENLLFRQGYDREFGTDLEAIERLRETIRTYPTVILFTHKTYIDGTTPNMLLYRHDMPMLHLFGGINLDIPVLGVLFRRSGTIFIRRSFQDNPVYKLVLRSYIAYLLNKRFPMTWALEGTRSCLGKLMPPRYGLLKYVLDAAHEDGIENLHIIPFVTSFDLIRDVEEYAAEQTGTVKKAESFKWFVGYLRSLRTPMGRVRIDLGEAVVVKQAPSPDDKSALTRIAFEASVQANRVTPLTVTSVMCLALLGAAPRGATAEELLAIVSYIRSWAQARGIRMNEELATGDRAAMRKTADTLVGSGLIIRHDQGSTIIYTIDPAKHPMASYYRNSIIHHFLEKTIIELALFKAQEEEGEVSTPTFWATSFWAETERLRDLFKFEFFYPPRDQYRRDLEAELGRIDPQWEALLSQGANGVRRLIRKSHPLVGHAALLPFVEAYTLVFEQLVSLNDGEQLDEKSCVARALDEGQQAYLLRRISSQASIGKILFENGYKLATNLGLTGETSKDISQRRLALLREFRSLSRRMERMRLAVLDRAEDFVDAAASR